MVAVKGDTRGTPMSRPNPARRSIGLPHPSTPGSNFCTPKDTEQYPLKNKDVVLDVMDIKKMNEFRKEITRLGGTIVEFVSEEKPPFLVVSDHPMATKLEVMKLYAGVAIGSELLRRLPLMLRDAVNHKVRVRHVASFSTQLAQLKNRYRAARLSTPMTNAPQKPSRPSISDKPRLLREPFIKFEDVSGTYGPSYKEMPDATSNNFSTIYLGKYFGQSLFHVANEEQQERRQNEIDIEKEQGYDDPQSIPRASVKPKPSKAGYCEICCRNADDLRVHFDSKEHVSKINQPGLYDEVDSLLGSFVDHIAVPHSRPLKRKVIKRESPEPSLDEDYRYSEGTYIPSKKSFL